MADNENPEATHVAALAKMFKQKYLAEASDDALAALRVQLNIDPSIPNNAIAYTALRSLVDAAAGVAAAMERGQLPHDARNDLRRQLDVAERSLEIAQRDIQHHQNMISSLENAVEAFKAHGPIKSDTKSAPDQIVNLLARLLEKQNKIDATDPDTLEDGLAAIDSLLHSHDDEYPNLSNSRSLLLAATQCFAGELRAWFDNLPADHEGRRSWAALKPHVLTRFPPGNAQQHAHQKLFELRCVDGSDWHRFTIEVQACAKKAKVEDSVVMSHIKATAGVVPDTFTPILLQLLGANKSLEEWFTHATAILSEGKLTHGPRVVAPAFVDDPMEVDAMRINDPTPNLRCRSHAEAQNKSRAVYRGQLRRHFREYRRQHNLCMGCGFPVGAHAADCPTHRRPGNA